MVKARPTVPPRKRAAPTNQGPRKRQFLDGSKIKGSETSLAERRRRQPTCSLASLRDLENEETLESDFIGLFGLDSENHDTWGKSEIQPIPATKKKGKTPRIYQEHGKQTFSVLGPHNGPKIPNSPDRSFFLRFPLEIRENIYEKLLHYPASIVVKHDFTMVERVNLRKFPILRVCGQIREEATRFVYLVNVFRIILRTPRETYHLRESFIIKQNYLAYMRNVIIECEKNNYAFDWYENACASLEKLVRVKATLDSLTFIMSPQRVGLTTTAVGTEANPIAFADFLYFPGRLMKVFRQIRCKGLNVIIKKTHAVLRSSPNIITSNQGICDIPECDTNAQPSMDRGMSKGSLDVPRNRSRETSIDSMQHDNLNASPDLDGSPIPSGTSNTKTMITRRFLMSLDLTQLARGPIEEGVLRNAATVEIQQGKARIVRKELICLKSRFEDIFEDDQKAVEEGKCRLMMEDERIIDIVSNGWKSSIESKDSL